MSKWAVIAIVAAAFGLSGCGSKFKTYDGPEVTRMILTKERRRLYLMHQDKVLRAFDVDLGFAPAGDKMIEGDGRTPEGAYLIDRRNPQSAYHLSIGIDYPRPHDVVEAAMLGFSPGGDIFIHGEPRKFSRKRDWTAGCIAVTNSEIEDIYAMVRDTTPILITP